MKFPVAFRVFASLNIIGFLIFFIQAVGLFVQPVSNSWILIASCFSATWFLVASILWFFGSTRSYSLLLINALVLWIMAGTMLYWGFVKGWADSPEDKVLFTVYGSIGILYSVFLLLSLRFKPIKEWSQENQSKLFDSRISTAFLISCVATVGAFYYLEVVKRQFIVLENVPPVEKISSTDVYVNFSYLVDMDGLVILNKTGSKEVEATIHFSDDYTSKAESEFSSAVRVVFKPFPLGKLRTGESIPTSSTSDSFLYADFPERSVRRILIQTVEAEKISGESVFTPLHSVAFFDNNTTADRFLTANPEEDVDDEQYFDDEPDGDFVELNQTDVEFAPALSQEHLLHFLNGFLQDRIEGGVWYYFNTSTPAIAINGQNIGHYLNFVSILEFFPETLNPFLVEKGFEESVVNYSLNSGVRKWTGLNLTLNFDEEKPAFKFVSSRFISWARQNLLPEANAKIGDQTVQEIYNQVFRRMFWQLAASHEYLVANNFDQEVKAYENAMTQPGFEGPAYLYDRYKGVESSESFALLYSNHPVGEGDYYYFTEQVAIGFWLRREIDVSHEELWKLVKDVLAKYDNYPFKQQ
jgi:hypothetical protein